MEGCEEGNLHPRPIRRQRAGARTARCRLIGRGWRFPSSHLSMGRMCPALERICYFILTMYNIVVRLFICRRFVDKFSDEKMHLVHLYHQYSMICNEFDYKIVTILPYIDRFAPKPPVFILLSC